MVKKFLVDIIDEDEFFVKLSKYRDERDKKILLQLKEQQEPLMTTSQCLEYLHISRNTLLELIKDGQIPFCRIRNSYRFSKTEVYKAVCIDTKL